MKDTVSHKVILFVRELDNSTFCPLCKNLFTFSAYIETIFHTYTPSFHHYNFKIILKEMVVKHAIRLSPGVLTHAMPYLQLHTISLYF